MFNTDGDVIGNEGNYPNAIYLTLKRKASVDHDWESVGQQTVDPAVDFSGLEGIDLDGPNTRTISSHGALPDGNPEAILDASLESLKQESEQWIRDKIAENKASSFGRFSLNRAVKTIRDNSSENEGEGDNRRYSALRTHFNSVRARIMAEN